MPEYIEKLELTFFTVHPQVLPNAYSLVTAKPPKICASVSATSPCATGQPTQHIRLATSPTHCHLSQRTLKFHPAQLSIVTALHNRRLGNRPARSLGSGRDTHQCRKLIHRTKSCARSFSCFGRSAGAMRYLSRKGVIFIRSCLGGHSERTSTMSICFLLVLGDDDMRALLALNVWTILFTLCN